jgi:pSer/pThr/pTyr-binding forkhead associated (FHA) protein
VVLGTPLPLVAEQPITLGRLHGQAAQLLAAHANVSGRHAEVMLRDGQVWITDLRSTNGTYIDGRRLEPFESTRLDLGAELRLAADITLHLEREQ